MIDVLSVTKRFGEFAALEEVSLHVARGELLALLGASGSGKTTLLRILAGLEMPESGQVLCDGADVTTVHPSERRTGFVFQHYALFGHMSVFENVAFGLRVMPRKVRPKEAEIQRRVKRLLELVRLGGLAEKKPAEISGGQKQRVALARALAIEPRLLLLDEPFGALDARVRTELRTWLRQLHDELHVTSVFVTHDQEEAMEVADRVAVLAHGRVEQVGTPSAVYDHPTSALVCEFFGEPNKIPFFAHEGRIESAWGTLSVPSLGRGEVRTTAYVRPEDVVLTREPSSAAVPARVRTVQATARGARVTLERDGDTNAVVAEIGRERRDALDLRTGDVVYARLRRGHVFPRTADG